MTGGVGTWVAILLLADAGAIEAPTVLATGSARRSPSPAALHRDGDEGKIRARLAAACAPDRAGAVVGADERRMIMSRSTASCACSSSGSASCPGFGVLVLGVGALSASAASYALFQHDLKRLLASHSIENVGIIVLGIGAHPSCERAEPRTGRRPRRGAPAHAQPRPQGAPLPRRRRVRCRRRWPPEIDRLGGLLRRMPWSGGAFGRGHGDRGPAAAERVRVRVAHTQALLHVPMEGGVADGTAARSRSRCSPRRRRSRLLLRSRSSDSACSARRGSRRCRGGTGARAVPAPRAAGACVLLGLAPGLFFGSLVGVAPWASAVPTQVGLDCPRPPAPHRRDRAGARGLDRRPRAPSRSRRAAPAPAWACGQLVEPARRRARALRSRCGSCSRPSSARSARSPCAARRASSRRSPIAATCRT